MCLITTTKVLLPQQTVQPSKPSMFDKPGSSLNQNTNLDRSAFSTALQSSLCTSHYKSFLRAQHAFLSVCLSSPLSVCLSV